MDSVGRKLGCLCWCCSINEHALTPTDSCGHPCDERLQANPPMSDAAAKRPGGHDNGCPEKGRIASASDCPHCNPPTAKPLDADEQARKLLPPWMFMAGPLSCFQVWSVVADALRAQAERIATLERELERRQKDRELYLSADDRVKVLEAALAKVVYGARKVWGGLNHYSVYDRERLFEATIEAEAALASMGKGEGK